MRSTELAYSIGGHILKQKLQTTLLASTAILLTFLLIKFPGQSLEASIRGLNMWWEIVFPSLLPFFIMAELLIGFGVVTFIGILFEPIMRPLFNVPGAGSFAWIMGMASGYPSGAKMSVRLREQGVLSKVEAERLNSFTNASSPLFIFGAISVGFFHDAQLGLLIAICHYLGNAFVGILMRFYGGDTTSKSKAIKERISLHKAFKKMHKSRLQDPRPFGEIIGDSVLNSIKTLVMVGGFIILFSVLTNLFTLIGLTNLLSSFFNILFQLLYLPIELTVPFLSGLFEITSGAELISKIQIDSLLPQIIVVSFLLGFNGFSVQAQVSSILAKSDINFSPYFFARLLHGTFASILTILLYEPLYIKRKIPTTDNLPAFYPLDDNLWFSTFQFMQEKGPLITIFCLAIGVIILLRKELDNKI